MNLQHRPAADPPRLQLFNPSSPNSCGPGTEITIDQVVALFLAHSLANDAPTTQRNRAEILERFRVDFGQRVVARLVPDDLEQWINGHTSWGEWRKYGVNRTVQACLRWAWRKRRMIRENPFEGVTYPQGPPGEPMTEAEFAALLANAKPLLARVLRFLRLTGARTCEARELQWSHIDWTRSLIVMQQHKTRKAQRQPRPRRIPIVPGLRLLLEELRNERPVEPADFVFLNSRGRRWQKRALCDRLQQLRERVGLREDCTLYGLRHRVGTDSIRHGNSLKETAELLGHTTTRITERYIHLAGEQELLARAMERATQRQD